MESPVRTVHLTQSHKVTNDQPTKLKYFTRRPNPGRPHFALGDMGRPPLPVKVDTGQQQMVEFEEEVLRRVLKGIKRSSAVGILGGAYDGGRRPEPGDPTSRERAMPSVHLLNYPRCSYR